MHGLAGSDLDGGFGGWAWLAWGVGFGSVRSAGWQDWVGMVLGVVWLVTLLPFAYLLLTYLHGAWASLGGLSIAINTCDSCCLCRGCDVC